MSGDAVNECRCISCDKSVSYDAEGELYDFFRKKTKKGVLDYGEKDAYIKTAE